MTTPWTIRQATDADLAAVSAWLQEEDARGDGGFWCNISNIEDCHRDAQITVLADPDSDQPLAFLCADPAHPEPPIMEVRTAHRRQGLGKALWEHHLDRVRAAGLPGLKIHCQPSASAPFWMAMGFRRFPERREFNNGRFTRDHLLMLLPHRPDFDTSAPRVEIGIRVTSEMDEDLESVVVPARVVVDDGYELEERYTFVWPNGDAYVEVSLNRTVLHPRAKFKYTDSGFHRCGCFRYLDFVELGPDA